MAACATIALLSGLATAREPWPNEAVPGPGFQFEALTPDPVMPAAPPSYAWPKPPRPQYIEPAPAPQAYVAPPVQSQIQSQMQAAVPVQSPAPMAAQSPAQYQPQQYQPQLRPQPQQAQSQPQSQPQYQPQYQPQSQPQYQPQYQPQSLGQRYQPSAPSQPQAAYQPPIQDQPQVLGQPQPPSQLLPQSQPAWQYEPQAAAQAPARQSLAMVPPPAQSVLPAPSLPTAESVLLPGQEAAPAAACDAIDDACPGYRLYAIADALFMGRYSGIANRPLAFNEDTGATVLSTQALQWGFVPGFRAFFGERKPGGFGWEVGYLGLYGLYSTTQAFGPSNLIAPGDLGLNGNQFNSADLVSVNYASTLNMGEANVFWYDCCRGGNACQGACQGGCPTNACQPACGGCRCIDWLAGFRFANLGETANFTSTCCGLTETSNYGVAATSNLFGGQVGVRGRKDYGHWACEGWLKMGLAGVWMSQTQSPILDFETGLPYRDGSSSSATGLAGFADANASAIYKFNRTWGLRFGVNAIWIGNVALAPNQWDFSQTASVTTLNTGSLVLLGGNVGVEARW